jgi:hypothetical protein
MSKSAKKVQQCSEKKKAKYNSKLSGKVHKNERGAGNPAQ